MRDVRGSVSYARGYGLDAMYIVTMHIFAGDAAAQTSRRTGRSGLFRGSARIRGELPNDRNGPVDLACMLERSATAQRFGQTTRTLERMQYFLRAYVLS